MQTEYKRKIVNILLQVLFALDRMICCLLLQQTYSLLYLSLAPCCTGKFKHLIGILLIISYKTNSNSRASKLPSPITTAASTCGIWWWLLFGAQCRPCLSDCHVHANPGGFARLQILMRRFGPGPAVFIFFSFFHSFFFILITGVQNNTMTESAFLTSFR